MAIISCSKRKTLYNVRSISFPARLHPTTRRVHEELNKLKSLESSSSLSLGESICLRLFGLAELYRCIQDLLNLPSTLQALAQTQLYEKWINDLLETSLNYLDVCSKTRETVLSLKQSLTEVQSALRRSNYKVADSSFKGYIANRKMVKKETGKCLASLKQVSTINGGGEHEQEVDEHVSSIVRVIEETSLMTNSILSSLLLFLMKKKVKPISSKWSLVSKLVQKKKPIVLVCVEDHQLYHDHETRVNELEVVDVALLLCKNYSCVEDELGKLEGIIEGFENGLDCLFRRLISTRVSLLDILSQ